MSDCGRAELSLNSEKIPQMKRQNPDNARHSGGKRYRIDAYNEALAEGKFELRLLIPTKCAGAVIGRGGEYIKQIREKFDASLTVPDRNTPERVFTIIVGQDRLVECVSEVLQRLSELQELQTKKTNEIEIKMLVHQSHAGAIIGRGGSKIKELREQTESNIKVFQECCPMSTDRVVQITATSDKMSNVIKTLVDFQREIAIKGIQKPYDAANYDPRMVFGYGGYSTDKPYMPRGHAAAPFSDFGRGGPPVQYGGGPPPFPRGGMPPPVALGGPGGFMGDQSQVSTTQVTIPNELGGTIIGKGGERINRIRQESGARIDIGSAYGTDERIITIAGSQAQIQTAQYLLQQSVRTSEAGRRYLREQR
ncbi:unnamed protein product [Bursaphelenchus xylophilus]|uniref:(pine wood nematode) hypothetical protein n=1 Tax=Bursaphelenchus xylophilus TaxID=6326 RepID=A0A1I7S7C1_BURXY|nr:unnamed protein product [Bursaphelenchus xylophilus]CAG9084893.1 unnamed protein product [Bursaphelenchus xylophilus]